MSEDKISIALELISAKGCDYCSKVLQTIKNNELPTELIGYSMDEVQKVWQELSSVMDVYDKNSIV